MKVVNIKTDKKDKKVFKTVDQYFNAVNRWKTFKTPDPYSVLTLSNGTMYVTICVKNWFEMLLCKKYFKDYGLEIGS